MNFVDTLRLHIKQEVFTEEDLKTVFSNKSNVAILSALSRSLKSKKIKKIRRGLYVFEEHLRRVPVSAFSIANKLYLPSYISFESALSFHEWIPEGVIVTTSASKQKKKKYFKTTLGDFSYDPIPCNPFFMGVICHKNSGGILIANPIKALTDLIYQQRKNYKIVEDLESDLRLDLTELKLELDSFSNKELTTLAKSYRSKRVENFITLLLKEMK